MMRVGQARSCPLTIVELMVAIAIIMMVSAALAWGIGSALRSQRFYDDVQRVADRLQLAQDLMLITDSDVEISFFRVADVTQMEFKIIGEVTPFLERQFEGTIPLPSIEGLWYEHNGETYDSQGKAVLKFFSSGAPSEQRRLELANIRERSGGVRRFIDIPAQPGPIRVEESLDSFGQPQHDLTLESQELFPYEMYSET